jgi:hypothetical protein
MMIEQSKPELVDIAPLGMSAELVTERVSAVAEEWVAYNDDLLPTFDDQQ